jgi:hypothetical protein
MGADARIAELTLRHRSLERTIEEESARPGADAFKIAELKKEKLRLKDEISRLSAG